jgi:hypothetical protein
MTLKIRYHHGSVVLLSISLQRDAGSAADRKQSVFLRNPDIPDDQY